MPHHSSTENNQKEKNIEVHKYSHITQISNIWINLIEHFCALYSEQKWNTAEFYKTKHKHE